MSSFQPRSGPRSGAGRSDPAGDRGLDLFRKGREYRLWELLGARTETRGGVAGTRFAVWAPNARLACVTGDFNEWTQRANPMKRVGKSGVWETFVPAARAGSVYKYEIYSRLGGHLSLKADPLARESELRPETGSVVPGDASYDWADGEWMAARAARQRSDRPMTIYEVHLGSWKRGPEESGSGWLSYERIADELMPYLKEMGYTHVELLPVSEHPFDGSWGYQTTGYFAPTSRFGTPDGFRRLVDRAHQAGIGVILDWVPAHFPRDAHGLGFFDGTPLYEHSDPQRAHHPDWGTYIFDYSKPEVVSFLLSSALFWLSEFHVDGLRVDAVASMTYLDYSRHPEEWTPNARGGREDLDAVAFLKRLNDEVHARHPGVLTFAEESTSWPGVTAPTGDGGLGFDRKWNMGWMNDTLSYFGRDPLLRTKAHDKLTFGLTYAFDERHLLPLSHDEVVHGKASLISKMPGSREQRFAGVRTLLGYMTAHPGKKLLFMGGELGQWSEWNHDAALEWDLLEHEPHRQLRECVRDLNLFYVSRPELWEADDGWGGFDWIDAADQARSVLSFVRRTGPGGKLLVVIANFTPVTWEEIRMGVPEAASYRVAFSTDREEYGGSGAAPPGTIPVESVTAHGRARSIVLTVPPLSVVFLEPGSPSG